MTSISVQCRLMPDVEQTGKQWLPGIFYNILISASNENGVMVPCSAKFRSTAILNDPVHKTNGTNWTRPVKSSMFGSVLWSINALTDAVPPPVEVQVEVAGTSSTVVVQPAANLVAMLQRLNEKTVDEWCGFLGKGYHATNLMHFAAAALSGSSRGVYEALIKSPSGEGLASLIKDNYNQQSGILTASEATNSQAAKAVTSTVAAGDATDVFMALMKAAGDSGKAGAVMKNFISDASELFQVMQLLLNQCGREIKDVFDWIELNLPWEDIGAAHGLLKSVAETLIMDLIGSGARAGKGWSDVTNSLRTLWTATSSDMGGQINQLMPVAEGLQKTWQENAAKLHVGPRISHQQFEMGWIGWRLTQSMPDGPDGIEDLIKSILGTLDFSRLSKALNELSEAMSGLDMSTELNESITMLQSFFTKIIRGDTGQVKELLSGGPELEALKAAPQLLFKLIDELQSKGESVITLVHACMDLIHDFITAPIENSFFEAIRPWLNPSVTTKPDTGISFLDLVILGVVTPGVVLFKGASQGAVFSLKDLQGLIGGDWSLNDIPVKDFVQKFFATLTQQAENTKGKDEQAGNQISDALPNLEIPSHKFPAPPPHFKEVCDGLCLFFEICEALSVAVSDTVKLAFEAEEIVTAGNEEEEAVTDTVNWTKIIAEFLDLTFETVGFDCKVMINLVRTVELYVLNEVPKAKWVGVELKRLLAFHSVYPEWASLANSGYTLFCKWDFLLVEFIMMVSEDEELAGGAADFEISGAAYTEGDSEGTKIIKALKGFTKAVNGTIGTFIKVGSVTNNLLYDDTLNSTIIPLANEVMSFIRDGKSPDQSEDSQQGENLGEMIAPWHNWKTTKMVCEKVSEGSRELSEAKELIKKIEEYGPALAFSWDLLCLLSANTTKAFSLAISVYQFNETYHTIDQAKSIANHK